MVTGKSVRNWILGLSCAVVPLTGCANGPMQSNGGLFSWFRRAPLTEREKQRLEQHEANERLKDPANLHLKYGQWRENIGDLNDARKSYQFALQENPKSLEAKIGLARLDQLAGRTAEAEEGFQNALKSRPDDAMAQNALGQFYASQKQWNKALPLLEDAADGAPGELTYRHHLAVALAQSGDMQGAFQHFKQVSGEAEAHYNVGYLLLENGQKEMARQRFQRALALNPNLMQAVAMLEEIDGKPEPTQIAKAPSLPPVARPTNPIQQTAAQQIAPPVRRNVPSQPVPNPIQQTAAQQIAPPVRRNVPSQPVMPAQSNLPTQTAPPVAEWRTATQPMKQPAPQAKAPVQPAPVAPSTPPAWRKHQAVNEAPQQAPNYLPPYRAEDAPTAPQNEETATPAITPAQREQWENQMRASNQ